MKRITALLLAAILLLPGCGKGEAVKKNPAPEGNPVQISLSDDAITVDGAAITEEPAQAVYAARDIVYYPAGQDFTFGAAEEGEAHEEGEARAHTVVHITQPGLYSLSGKLSRGQIAVDLGENAKTDPNAVVTLILNGVDITSTVSPAVIFYNVFECAEEEASYDVDTSAAGANVWLADGTENRVTGAYVARIYEPASVVLSEDGKEVADYSTLYKYDGAFYSCMSMNVSGNDGILHIDATNEGLDTEMHLTVNGGDIRIESGNDGINVNEDGVSVATMNGGRLSVTVTGETGEGDGIDSNGWLVINGGTLSASACGASQDAGIDSDMGIYLNGGTLAASGHMLDQIAGGSATYGVFTFAGLQNGGSTYSLKNSRDKTVLAVTPTNDFSVLVVSSPDMQPGDYSFWRGGAKLVGAVGQGFGGMMRPEGMERPEGMQRPGGSGGFQEFGSGGQPNGFEGMTPPEGIEMPEGMSRPGGIGQMPAGEVSEIFTLTQGANYFSFVSPAE